MSELNLHIGPHKTATTHMQNVLERSTFRDGAKIVPLWLVRKALSGHLNRGEVPEQTDFLDHDGLLMISEENLSGFPLAGVRLYPRIADVLSFFRDSKPTVFFSPRHYASFIPSVFSESLRHGRYVPFPSELVDRGWPDVLRDIEAALPGATIKIWLYEDYRANWREILRFFSNGKIDTYGTPPPGDPRSSLSNKAIMTYAQMHEFVTDPNAVLSILGDAFPVGVSNPKFLPFDVAQTATLTRRYREDVETLRSRYEFFEPEPAEQPA